MPSGFRVDTDGWIKEYEESRELAQEIVQLIQDRNINNASGGPEASRKTAAARRKIGTLGTQLEKLLKWLDTPEAAQLSELEKNRRRDLLYDLKGRREQMQFSLKRQHGDKDTLFEGNGNGRNGAAASAPQETERTAELDARGLLQLHTTIMKQQDEELGEMEKAVANTKHVALAIGEEVDLQTRLLDELDEDVDVTHTRMRAATAKVRQILRRSSNWKAGFCIFLLIVVLVFVVIVALKLQRLVIG